MDAHKLQKLFELLSPWAQQQSFSESDWRNYIVTAKAVQRSIPAIVESALDLFMQEALREEFRGYENESKIFLLMRVVFDLPEVASVNQRRSFKGWVNWPEADQNGNVSLLWPISWQAGKPALVASYEGSEGLPYAAVQEYRYFLDHFPYRQLGN